MNQMATRTSNSKEPFFCCMYFHEQYNIFVKNTRSSTSEQSQGRVSIASIRVNINESDGNQDIKF